MISSIKKNIIIFFLLFIFFLAAGLRFYKLSEFPVGFHIDEAILGYTAYSLLLTGKDTNNNLYPLYTEVFGDNLPTGYHVLTMIPVKLFGLTEFATRFTGAFIGSFTIFAVFFLAYSIFQDKKVSVLTSFLLAISPWHVALSRSSSEAEVSLFFVVLGFSLVIFSFHNQQIKYIVYGTIILLASYFFYHTPRVFVPIVHVLFLGFVFLRGKKQNPPYKTWLLVSFFITAMSAFLLVFVLAGGSSRLNQISIFGFPETKLVMEEQIREDGMMNSGVFLTRMFHNKIVNYSLTFISQYLEYFSGNFLFVKGGLPLFLAIPQAGLVYLVELPFLLAGVITLFTDKKKIYKFPLIWLLVAPIVAAVTTDDIPNVRRAITMVPVLEMIAAYGFFFLLFSMRRKIIRTIFIMTTFVLLLFNTMYVFHLYFIHAPIHKNWYRNDGFKEMLQTVKNSYNDIDKIIVTKDAGGIYPLVLFYMQYDPRAYQTEGSPKDPNYGGFGKFMFVSQACPSKDKYERFSKDRRIIYVDKGECEDKAQHQKIIYRKDGTRAFNIVYE